MTDTANSAKTVGERLLATVPMVRSLDLEVIEATAERALLRLPDRPEFHNHVGGPHAGALFTLGETASGAVVMAAFEQQFARVVPLVVRVEIAYRKLARGPVTAAAVLGRPAEEVLAELDRGQRPEFPVTVVLNRADGAECAQLDVLWTLRPHT